MKLFAPIATAAMLAAAASQAEEMLVLTEEFKPYQYEDDAGQPTGFMVELVTLMFDKAGIDMVDGKVHIYPWARTYETLLETKDSAAFMTVRTEQREDLLKWVGPLAPREMWLYKLSDRPDIQAKTLDDAKAYTIGGYLRGAQTDYLLELGFPHVEIAPHERLNVDRLLKGRVDMIPSLELMMAARLKDAGASYDSVERVVVLDDRFDYYLAVNLETSNEMVQRLQAALDALKSDGTYDRLKKQYLY